MIIGKRFNLWPQHCLPRVVPTEEKQKADTGSPDLIRVRIDGHQDIEQMLNIRVLRDDPSCFSESGRSGIDVS